MFFGGTTALRAADETTPQAGSEVYVPLADIDLPAKFDSQDYDLKHLGARVDKARERHDAATLADEAFVLFRVEEVTGRKIKIVTGLGLLKEATAMATTEKDPRGLRACAKVWENTTYGMGDSRRADELRHQASAFEAEKKRTPNK
jgi:hypothetical protein